MSNYFEERKPHVEKLIKKWNIPAKVVVLNEAFEAQEDKDMISSWGSDFEKHILNGFLDLLKLKLIITPEEHKKLIDDINKANVEATKNQETKKEGKTLIHHKYMKKYGDHSIRDHRDGEFGSVNE